MSPEMEFFSFLLEEYAEHIGSTAPEVLKIWDETKIFEMISLTEYIIEKYFIYHIESINNAFMDIDNLIKNGKPLY